MSVACIAGTQPNHAPSLLFTASFYQYHHSVSSAVDKLIAIKLVAQIFKNICHFVVLLYPLRSVKPMTCSEEGKNLKYITLHNQPCT